MQERLLPIIDYLGQMQLYVNYYDRRRRSTGDNPALGLILFTAKNDAVVRYTLADGNGKKIFASRYRLHVPTEAQLATEITPEIEDAARRWRATPLPWSPSPVTWKRTGHVANFYVLPRIKPASATTSPPTTEIPYRRNLEFGTR
ncbi:MAG: PDDEXK nuclease domain-containing protein [Phycisphaerae bacterium]